MFENRRWLIIPTNITGSIDFGQVYESSSESLRLSLDGTKTFVKYDIVDLLSDETYTFIDAISGQEMSNTTPAGVYGRPSFYDQGLGEFTHSEIIEILSGDEWTDNNMILPI